MRSTWKEVLAVAALTIASSGCSTGPAAVAPPSFDADGAAAKALELYDNDHDGSLAGAELDAAPGLKATLSQIDANGDGKIEESEIADRIRAWLAMNVGIMAFETTVTLDGAPLTEATVTYEPEEFLADVIQSAVGTTSPLGIAICRIPKDKRPSPDTPPGMQAGIYRVRISKSVNGQEKIPAKYNAETILGQQVSRDDKVIVSNRVIFKLKSK